MRILIILSTGWCAYCVAIGWHPGRHAFIGTVGLIISVYFSVRAAIRDDRDHEAMEESLRILECRKRGVAP